MAWTIDATIVSTGGRATLVVDADQRDVTLSIEGSTLALTPAEVNRLRAALGQAEVIRSQG